MTTKFFDRNKKKGLLGLVLLWIKENRTVSALLLIVALASFLFVAPSALVLDLPGGAKLVAGIAWIASRAGVDTSKWGFYAKGGARSYDDFIAQLRAAKAAGARPAGWGPFFGKAAEGSGRSSLDMVQGRRQDLAGGAYPGGKLPQGKDVSGILTPEDAGNSENGVAVDDALLAQRRGGLVGEANAGGFAPGAKDLLGFVGRPDAYAGKGFFGGGSSAGTRPDDKIKNALATTETASAPRGRVQGGSSGRLSQARAAAMSARVQKGVQARSLGMRSAFGQLADGRGRAAVSTAPHCVPPGCPGEFAATNSGAIYDGNVGSGSAEILSAPEIDGATPTVPDASIADGYMQEAGQLQADAQKCRELDDHYTPLENAASAKMQEESDRFSSMGCGGGGCSKSKAKRCKAQGEKIKAACREYMSIRNEHTNACPLTAGKGNESNSSCN